MPLLLNLKVKIARLLLFSFLKTLTTNTDGEVKESLSQLDIQHLITDFNNMMIKEYTLKKLKNKRGGTRKNSGAKPKYNEQTKTVAFRCPLSKVDELKFIVKSKLSEWSVK